MIVFDPRCHQVTNWMMRGVPGAIAQALPLPEAYLIRAVSRRAGAGAWIPTWQDLRIEVTIGNFTGAGNEAALAVGCEGLMDKLLPSVHRPGTGPRPPKEINPRARNGEDTNL
jgi:hypothetical protein